MPKVYDVIIAGGGVAGCAAAAALSNIASLNIAVVELCPPTKTNVHPSFDSRVIALANASLSHLRSWDFDIDAVNGAPIERIHVSDRKHIGQVVLDAQSANVAQLGKVVRLEDLGLALYKTITSASDGLEQKAKVDYFTPEYIASVTRSASELTVVTQKAKEAEDSTEDSNATLANAQVNTQADAQVDKAAQAQLTKTKRTQDKGGRTLKAKLLIIAEGADSKTRNMLGIRSLQDDYEQHAVITNVTTQLPHNNCAFERFTKYGPLAFLPMASDEQDTSKTLMSVVWTTSSHHAQAILDLPEKAFLYKLGGLFGSRLGRIESASPRASYPLLLKQSPEFSSHRVICIGNAAQSLHPIAGQGFNLGVRDIQDLLLILQKTLAETNELQPALKNAQDLSNAAQTANSGAIDIGSFAVTQAYKHARSKDKQAVIGATDLLVRGFSNHDLPFVLARNKALIAMNALPSAKRAFSHYAMGER
ncbi:FAD-dependent monooxygenase [Glaciecola siphonariae]|uniref:FAD-dependent monooxygenase n=1 Tax=Glaciecola siphonariae TaxID=521012 RepID=A0ABV9LWM6_9ALTE